MLRPKPKLTDSHIKQISEYFDLLDDDHDGKLQPLQVSILYRALGQTISEASLGKKLDELLQEISGTKESNFVSNIDNDQAKARTKGEKSKFGVKRFSSKTLHRLKSSATSEDSGIDFEQFINFFVENYTQPTSKRLLIEAFALFDENRLGFITAEKLNEILTRRGESLSSAEVNEVLLLAGSKDKSAVDYVQLAERLVKGPQNVRSV